MSKAASNPKEFEDLLDDVGRQLLDATTHLDIWEALFPTEESVRILNRYRGFFVPTQQAHLDQTFIKIANLTHSNPNAPNLYGLLNMVKENSTLAPELDVVSLRRRLKGQRAVFEGVKTYRNTRSAHFDRVRKPPAVLLGEIRSLLKELVEVVNAISSAHSHSVWSFKYLEHRDVQHLLSDLADLKKRRDEELEKLIKRTRQKANV